MLDSPHAPPLRILLVDDHEPSARALSRLLRARGYFVTTAYTFAGALVLAAAGAVDVLICDLELPDGNGCELLVRLRAYLAGRRLPAIAITGHDGWTERCTEAGYARFLSKPLQLEEVIEAIQSIRPGNAAISRQPTAIASPQPASPQPPA